MYDLCHVIDKKDVYKGGYKKIKKMKVSSE